MLEPESAQRGEEAPYRPFARIVTRGLAEYGVHFLSALTARFDGDVDIGLIFVHLLRRADLDGTGVGAMAPTSISALSRSTARPFETVRRLCNRLCAMGLAKRCEAGPFVPAEILSWPMVMELREAFHDNFVRMIGDLAKIGYPLPATRGGGIGRGTIERAAIDVILHAFEFGTPPFPKPNWQRPFVYLAVMAANSRPFTFDPELAHRYVDFHTPPPEALRTPIGASALARAIALPYSTVRNNLEWLLGAGILARSDKGYLISMAWMQRPELAATAVAIAAQIDRSLRQLALAGFPIDAPETAYWRGPPKFIRFD